MVKWALGFLVVVLVKVLLDYWRVRRSLGSGLDNFDFKAAKSREALVR
ncbi:MAG: hypothetical protein AB1916_00715 [Thermodesulfobacteriota bacterium]